MASVSESSQKEERICMVCRTSVPVREGTDVLSDHRNSITGARTCTGTGRRGWTTEGHENEMLLDIHRSMLR